MKMVLVAGGAVGRWFYSDVKGVIGAPWLGVGGFNNIEVDFILRKEKWWLWVVN